MVQRLKALAVAVVTIGLLGSGGANATPLSAPLIPGNVTDILWVSASNAGGVVSGLGTSDIRLDGTANTLTLAVVQTVTATESLGGIFGSLAWDSDLGNELSGPGVLTEVSMGFFKPATPGYDDPLINPPTQDSSGAQSGFALGLDAINAGIGVMVPGPSGTTFTAFTVTFSVNTANLADDGNDIFWGAFGTGNAIGTDGGGSIYTAGNSPWAGASVAVPEAGAVPLIAIAAGAVLLVGRRGRR